MGVFFCERPDQVILMKRIAERLGAQHIQKHGIPMSETGPSLQICGSLNVIRAPRSMFSTTWSCFVALMVVDKLAQRIAQNQHPPGHAEDQEKSHPDPDRPECTWTGARMMRTGEPRLHLVRNAIADQGD